MSPTVRWAWRTLYVLICVINEVVFVPFGFVLCTSQITIILGRERSTVFILLVETLPYRIRSKFFLWKSADFSYIKLFYYIYKAIHKAFYSRFGDAYGNFYLMNSWKNLIKLGFTRTAPEEGLNCRLINIRVSCHQSE